MPLRLVLVTLDGHLVSTVDRAHHALLRELPGLSIGVHVAAEWADDPAALQRCLEDIARADILLVTMLFLEDHFRPVLPALQARRDHCDALVACMCAQEVVRLTRLGRLSMDGGEGGALGLLRRLRGRQTGKPGGAGSQQMQMLRRLPRILRFVPGAAQDLRAYLLTLQYWLAGSEDNVANLVRFLVDRYADGPRRPLRGRLKPGAPAEYPDVGLYHPGLRGRIGERPEAVPAPSGALGTVGLLVMRSYVLAGNSAHYDGVIAALEAKGLRVLPAFATGLDARPAIERFFLRDGRAVVDAVVSLTGFSLVGGPAYNDARAAEETLARLDVPYLAAFPVEFQSLAQWQGSSQGLTPVESTMMVAIPELDGSVGPMVFGGRSGAPGGSHDMEVHGERASALAARVARLVALRRTPRVRRRVAVVLFNFPPNAGHVGTAAYLSVFASLWRTLKGLAAEGYEVDVPESVEALRTRIMEGNRAEHGTDANVAHRVSADEHVRREPWLREIEAQWGPAPGRVQTDGDSLFVLGAHFGQVFVGVQPAFGYEGDPMRLLFERGFAPTHAFSAFYRYLREDFGAHVCLHFGTHGALEFMPGKQVGLSAECWPDRLLGDLPNVYLYAANNPSEGTLAKRRSAATLVSYLTPPVQHAGLYRGLADLKASLERWRACGPEDERARGELECIIQAEAAALDLADAEPPWADSASARITDLAARMLEYEYALIPHGLHVVGEAPSAQERQGLLGALAEASAGVRPEAAVLEALVQGASAETLARQGALADAPDRLELLARLVDANRLLAEDHELPGLLRALDGRYVRPAPGGDLLRTTAILPTGRNLHGFDPFKLPSGYAMRDGARQAARILARHCADGHPLPESVALVLWGTDNLKSDGSPIAQALALMGTRPRFDSYGRLAGAELMSLEELGRPRIDVVMTLSGIFRDLLPLQTRLLAEAAWLAASADEAPEHNFVRKHALAYQQAHGCTLETAALRVFSNADGAYGANVSHLVHNGRWEDCDELAETYSRRKCFAYGRAGQPEAQPALLESVLGSVELAYQNLDSVELGVTTLDQYFDTLGGISSAAQRSQGRSIPVYIGDQTRGEGAVRTLSEQVALETRTRILNPKWYEGMLAHGFEGVRQIEEHVANTMGWSATTGQVAPWVYERVTETFVLDPEMRERLANLNPVALARVANRLLEAHERQYWTPDEDVLAALRRAGDELEDRLEGIGMGIAA